MVDAHVAGRAGVQEEQRVGALVLQDAPVGGQDVDVVVVDEDLLRGLREAGVELRAHDPGVVAQTAAQPGGADAATGAELGHGAAAGRCEGGQQAAGLVAAERHVAGLAGDGERALDDVGELGRGTHVRTSLALLDGCLTNRTDPRKVFRTRKARSYAGRTMRTVFVLIERRGEA